MESFCYGLAAAVFYRVGVNILISVTGLESVFNVELYGKIQIIERLFFSYSDILIEREVLMQKYIHLVQIVETEKIAANQLRQQLEDQDTEIERLKSEVLVCEERLFTEYLYTSSFRAVT